MQTAESREAARAAILMALTTTRADEDQWRRRLRAANGISCCAVDFGGLFVGLIPQIIERAVVAAKREGLILPLHSHEGAVAGAAHEAAMGVAGKAGGLNVGGKLGVARLGEHVVVALFCMIGLGHLDDAAIALGHRAIATAAGEGNIVR